jgi:predicted AlkP superfamily phosphohydrolase/phosphomutase
VYKKVVILGLDGVSFTLLHDFMKRGYMPNLASIVKDGTLTQMHTTIPDLSAVAWTSLFTGKDPGGHGIFGFTHINPRTYEVYATDSTHIMCGCLWDLLGIWGKRSVIINVPATYPARPIGGILVAGFVATDLKRAVYPKATYEYLKGMEYRLDVDTSKVRDSKDYFAENLWGTLKKRISAIWHFWETENWDLFMAVLTETDRINHFLWDAWDNEQHPYHEFFVDYYKKIDRFLGNLYDRCLSLGSEYPVSFMMLSDHGFTRAKGEVYIDYWLKEQGLLACDCPTKIDGATTVFALDQGRIYINHANQYAKGGIDGKSYDRLRWELFENLSELRQKTPFFKGVFRKEDLYTGTVSENVPDLVLLPESGFVLKGGFDKDILTGHSPLVGTHTQDDAFFFINEKRYLSDLKIHEVLPIILGKMGLNGIL